MSDAGFVDPISVPRANGQMASYGDDAKLYVEFFTKPVYQEFASKGGETGDILENGNSRTTRIEPGAGYAIYKNIDYILIQQPGAKSNVIRQVKMVSDERGPSDLERFPRQWAAYQNQKTQVGDGLPLEEWPMMDKALALSFKSVKIHTVEQLSNLSDANMASVPVMDARKYRDMAVKYLERARGEAPITAMQSELELMKKQNEALQKQMADLLANQTKRGPGRPSKEADNGTS